jgi:hypothetical protein
MLQILSTGLHRSGKGMLGPGIYWSDDLKKAKAYGDGTLLKLSIAQGKTQTVDRQDHPMRVTWVAAGYHTSVVPPKCGMVPSGLGEMCTFYPDRVVVVGISRDHGKSWAAHP